VGIGKEDKMIGVGTFSIVETNLTYGIMLSHEMSERQFDWTVNESWEQLEQFFLDQANKACNDGNDDGNVGLMNQQNNEYSKHVKYLLQQRNTQTNIQGIDIIT